MHTDSYDLAMYFDGINRTHFDGFLETPLLRWNTRLRASAGRFIPGSRKYYNDRPAVIEVASYLAQEEASVKFIEDTLAHEMIHYWLWVLRRPYGHTPAFWDRMRKMGVSRYNPVPKIRPYRYVYVCVSCSREFPARRKLANLACAACCKAHSGGRYDSRYRLALGRAL